MPKLALRTWIMMFFVITLLKGSQEFGNDLLFFAGCLFMGVMVAMAYSNGYDSAFEE